MALYGLRMVERVRNRELRSIFEHWKPSCPFESLPLVLPTNQTY